MHTYDVMVEETTPCGGSKYGKKQFLEVTTDDPEAYVKANGKWPIQEVTHMSNGDVLITTSDVAGNIVRYLFSE